MRNKLLLVFVWMFTCLSSVIYAADGVTFTADAPRTVVMGQNFNIVYTSNTETKDLRIAEFNNFEILSGPFTSTMSSTSIVNGQYSSSTTFRFTYVLAPQKIGTFNIPAATATIKGSKYSSNSLTIKVLPEADNTNGALRAITTELDKMTKANIESSIYSEYDEQFQGLAWIILIVLLIDVFILERKNKYLRKVKLF